VQSFIFVVLLLFLNCPAFAQQKPADQATPANQATASATSAKHTFHHPSLKKTRLRPGNSNVSATGTARTTAAASSSPPSPPQRVQLIEDQNAGAVRVVVDGKDVARIDANGLHVRGDVAYGGVSLDYGGSGFDSYVAGHSNGK
jgi:hypothetical protein